MPTTTQSIRQAQEALERATTTATKASTVFEQRQSQLNEAKQSLAALGIPSGKANDMLTAALVVVNEKRANADELIQQANELLGVEAGAR